MKKIVLFALAFACLLTPTAPAQSSDIPRLEKKDGRFALIVDGKPFLVLGRPDRQLQRMARDPSRRVERRRSHAREHRRGTRLLGAD